jgi:hypothetical protein
MSRVMPSHWAVQRSAQPCGCRQPSMVEFHSIRAVESSNTLANDAKVAARPSTVLLATCDRALPRLGLQCPDR